MKHLILTLVLSFFIALLSACEKQEIKPGENEELIKVILSKGETYEKSLGNFGIEEGVSIHDQAAHYSKSEVYRVDESMEMVYEYVPAIEYTGKDEVVISKYTGDIRDVKSGKYSYLKIQFTISK